MILARRGGYDRPFQVAWVVLCVIGMGFLFTACSSTAVYNNKSSTQTQPKKGSSQYMVASWYGNPYHGRKTASGETYNMYDHTAAHKTLPFGTRLRLVNESNNKQVVVRINDRGPFIEGRDIDVSYKVAQDLGFVDIGVCRLKVIFLN